jgi:hypothetical protein
MTTKDAMWSTLVRLLFRYESTLIFNMDVGTSSTQVINFQKCDDRVYFTSEKLQLPVSLVVAEGMINSIRENVMFKALFFTSKDITHISEFGVEKEDDDFVVHLNCEKWV